MPESLMNQTLGTREMWDAFQANPIDMYRDVAQRMFDAGIEEKPTLSRALEEISPTEKGDLDAFERLLQQAGIRTHSDPIAGYWASNAGEFAKSPGTRALLGEFFARNWRKVSFAGAAERAVILSDTGSVGSWQRPYVDAAIARVNQQVQVAIPLSELVAITTPINSDTYRSFYLTYDATALRKFRVGETAEIPIADIVGAEHTIGLHKYGRGLRASYEALRRMTVDKLARFIQWMAVQSEMDKVSAALAILIAGDGNSNTAATEYDISTLDATATTDELTLLGWMAYKMKFAQPYMLTTALMNEAVAVQLAMLNTGSGNVPLSMIPNMGGMGLGVTPINQSGDGVRYGWTSDAPTGKIVGWDKRFALEHVTEIGAEITETERYITNQTQVLVMTEVDGFAILDGNATKILDVFN